MGAQLPTFEFPNIEPEWHDTTTVSLGELIEGGWLDWSSDQFDWSKQAYNAEQYARVCDAFEKRFYYREISILPPKRWAMKLMYAIRIEIAPVCNQLYDAVENAQLFASKDDYGKERIIESDYPETLLSENSDYLSSGRDREYEYVSMGDTLDKLITAVDSLQSVDAIFLDRCERFFSSLITTTINY